MAGGDDTAIEAAVFALLAARAADATLCPSEVARSLRADEVGWRALMPDVRRVAAALAAQGRVRVSRGGVEVDALAGAGPVRIGHPSSDD